MASEEVQSNSIQSQAEPPAPAVAVDLPPYPELILAAVEALGDPNGSNKSAIWRQIESTYGSLPPAHFTILTHHLNLMKSAGTLVFMKNNYLKPDANAPPRRGRGRPPKPKIPLPEGYSPGPSRPRGRPPKSQSRDLDAPPPLPKSQSRDLDAPPPSPPPKPTSAVSGRKRGRPPKATTVDAAAAPAPAPTTAAGSPRGRGRPPKVKPAVTAPVGA